MHDYDMVVIGSGPSGRRAAVQFAKLGRSVLGFAGLNPSFALHAGW
jgi:pyruvate/2-oxoglutarate dehydrogenase complex dihydrolipoamide dehydrogenase (E3) component